MSALLWLRRDLRRGDLPALGAAAEHGDVHAVFVIDPAIWGSAGTVRTAWLAASLRAARASYDGRLSVRVGDPRQVIPRLGADHDSVHVSSEPFPYGRARDEAVREALPEGCEWVETGSPYAVSPGRVVKDDDSAYQVFTPFSRAWRKHGWRGPAQEPEGLTLAPADDDGRAEQMIDKALREGPDDLPDAGEDAALDRWRSFLDEAVDDYEDRRDLPAVAGTSRLSPYLKVGAIHPRTILADLAEKRSKGAEAYETEICWRDFYADVLWRNPESAWHDLKPLALDYDDSSDGVEAWKQGRTGFPVVDAGMRQLLETGWMHNRVRMITASFLSKDLHVWWPVGARHFLEHLLDGDLASNNHGWQWAAGTGTDASPYFRVFNPITQGQKFDPDGSYVRRWVPELAHLEGKAAHVPWEHDDGYDHDYPQRIVDHKEEREKALDRYQKAK